MPRKSAEAKSAELWRTGAEPPRPPAHLSRPARSLWRSIAASKPAYFWTEGAKLLLSRLCQTAATVQVLHNQLDADPIGKGASDLNRRVVALNASVATFSRQLRLGPLQEISSEATERASERGAAFNELIGTRIRQGNGRLTAQ